MLQRGGGIEEVKIKQLDEKMIVLELYINVCDSMGANIVNTVSEGLSNEYLLPFIIGEDGRIALRILSNLCTERLSISEFKIPVKDMAYKGLPGQLVVEKILEGQ